MASWRDTPFTRKLGLSLPLVQAPMGGGPTTPSLVAAVSEAGGLGSIAGGYLSPAQIRAEIAAVRARTRRPFAVNLFVPEREPVDTPQRLDPRLLEASRAALRPLRDELGLPDPVPPARFAEVFEEQLAVLIEERVACFSFTFGIPGAPALDACRRAGIALCGTATTVAEAIALADAGVDFVSTQGFEAGAHRGSFLLSEERSLVGSLALVPQAVDALAPRGIPVLAAGGIMDGRGIAAVLVLGAQAAVLGTAFLRTKESGANATWKAALAQGRDDSTALTRAFSGKAARGIRNRFTEKLAAVEGQLPPYPAQNALTRDIRAAAAKAGNADYLSLWAGQGVALARELPTGELVALLARETETALERR
jgi:nitronate monooxygenase